MITRSDYLNKKSSHEEYYGQFVTKDIRNLVVRVFGKEQLTVEYHKNNSFNGINLYKRDSLAPLVYPHLTRTMKSVGDYSTLCGAVCTLKEAARQVVLEESRV